jgi:hypothetical protein
VKLQPHVVAAVAWLGSQWQPLLAAVGLTV